MIQKIKNLFSSSSKELMYTLDLHSHLIPGIDDGVKTMDESIAIITELEGLGFKKLITTPHIMQHRYPNTSKIILEGLEKVRQRVRELKLDIEIDAACEYYLDGHFLELIRAKDILTFNGNHVLFEMSYTVKPINLKEVIFEMIAQGYQPVLAHPERYMFMHNNFNAYKEVKELGVLFQVNLNSLSGYYSKPVQRIGMKLLNEGMINYLGSDIHKQRHLKHFSKNISSGLIKQIFKKNNILNTTMA